MIRTSLASNFLGNVWNTLLTLALVPIQIALLGVEAFGLISMIGVLQVVLGALDFGLSATITREIATGTTRPKTLLSSLVNSIATIYWGLALLVAVTLWFGTEVVATTLLKGDATPRAVVVDAIHLIALYLGLRWPIAFYTGVLSGVSRLGVVNTIKSVALTVRLAGGVVVLWISPDLGHMLWWYVSVAALELGLSAWYAKQSFPALTFKASVNWSAIRPVWQFSVTMYAIGLLSILLTQLDRLFIGKFLGLQSLGYYSVAYSLAIGLSLIQMSINSAALPAFSAAYGSGSGDVLNRRYIKFGQLMSLLVAPAAFGMVFLGRELLALWVNPEVAEHSWQILSILAVGFLMNATFSNAYVLAVAMGKPQLFLRANAIGVCIYLAALFVMLDLVGMEGGAIAWLVLNSFYLFLVLPRVHREFHLGPIGVWLRQCVLRFVIVACLAFGLARLFFELCGGPVGLVLGIFIAIIGYGGVSWRLLTPDIQRDFSSLLKLSRT